MGRIFKVEYDRNADVPYYVCGHCRTEIAKDSDRYMANLFGAKPLLLLEKMDNMVEADEQHYREEWDNIIADVNCVQCNSHLGYKIIRRLQGGNAFILGARVHTFAMFVAKLLKWNGTDFVAADHGL